MFDSLQKILEQFAEVFTEVYKDELRNKRASGNLADSVKQTVKVNGNNYEVEITLQDYWKYVEYGRAAGSKFPPIDAIKNWIRVKNLQVQPDAFGGIPTENQLTFLIARGIAEKGIPATNFLQESFDKTYLEFTDKIFQAFSDDAGSKYSELLDSAFADVTEIQLL